MSNRNVDIPIFQRSVNFGLQVLLTGVLVSALIPVTNAQEEKSTPERVSTRTGQAQQDEESPKPLITDIRFVSLERMDENNVAFVLAVRGEGLPDVRDKQDVRLDTKDPGFPVRDIAVGRSNHREVSISGIARAGAEITRVMLGKANELADTGGQWAVSIKPKQKQ